MSETLNVKKEKIERSGLDRIQKYFDLDEEKLVELDSNILHHLYNMARLGMQFEREMNINTRAIEHNFVRIGKIITENKEELKKYIKRTLPQYQ